MSLYLTFDSVNLKQKAINLSTKLNLRLVDLDKDNSTNLCEDDYFLVCSASRIFLQRGLKKNTKPIYSDFDTWINKYDDLLLRRALKGLTKNFSCLDLTAGFGKDAFEIAKSKSCQSLILVEKEKWVYELLLDGLTNATDFKSKILIDKFQVFNSDNFEYLRTCKDFDLIYIDPMFAGVDKSKAKKHMQALRDLSNAKSKGNLLEESLKKATQKVIVKRHRNMEFLESIQPSHSIEGKVVRYDVYSVK